MVKREEPQEIEVDFPCYSKHNILPDHGDSVIYRRTDSDGRSLAIQYTDTGAGQSRRESFELEIEYVAVEREPDYFLGRGKHASSQQEFEAALAKATEFLKRFG